MFLLKNERAEKEFFIFFP